MPSEAELDWASIVVTPLIEQRGSGHLAVPGILPDSEPDQALPRSRDESARKREIAGVYVSQHLSFVIFRKASEESQGQNRTREIRSSGIVGGPTET